MRKVLILLSLTSAVHLLLIGLYSCRKNVSRTGCNTSQTYGCAKLDSIIVKAYKSAYSPLAANQAVKATELLLEAEWVGKEVTCYNVAPFSPFITSAYACTPPLPIYSIKDSIEMLTITSNRDFNASHPAGVALNEYFTIPGINRLNTLNDREGGVDYRSITHHQFQLNQAPADDGIHVFTLTIQHKSGNLRTVDCIPIKLLK